MDIDRLQKLEKVNQEYDKVDTYILTKLTQEYLETAKQIEFSENISENTIKFIELYLKQELNKTQ